MKDFSNTKCDCDVILFLCNIVIMIFINIHLNVIAHSLNLLLIKIWISICASYIF